MRITWQIRKQINEAARDMCRGGGGLNHCEVGKKFDRTGKVAGSYFNCMFFQGTEWDEDLDDIIPLADLNHLEDHPSGEAEIDVYVYRRTSRPGEPRDCELSGNLIVRFKDGKLVSAEPE